MILTLVLTVIATEAVVTLLRGGSIFSKLQDWAEPEETILQKLFSCGYCLSVWVALVLWISTLFTVSVVAVLAVHRLSNAAHHLQEIVQFKALEYKT